MTSTLLYSIAARIKDKHLTKGCEALQGQVPASLFHFDAHKPSVVSHTQVTLILALFLSPSDPCPLFVTTSSHAYSHLFLNPQ